jgi:hypothetical protein
MPIDIKRRNAFAYGFKQYPYLLEAFVEQNVTMNGIVPKDRATKFEIMQVLMAQFITRLIRTRAQLEKELREIDDNRALEWFAFETVAAYTKYRNDTLEGKEIEAPPQYQRALNLVENNMSTTIFEALSTEIRITPAEVIYDEGSFWFDVFLSFCQNQEPKRHPRWFVPVNHIILLRMAAFRDALAGHVPAGAVLPPREQSVH